MDLRVLQLQHDVRRAARLFLEHAGYLEVVTPVRIPTPALEEYITAEESGNAFLRTSPELHMKRLLAAGAERIYQIGPCFRRDERSPLHLPEFTMLEWYRTGADAEALLEETVEFFRFVVAEATGALRVRFQGRWIDFEKEWEQLPVARAFRIHAGRDLAAVLAAGEGGFEEVLTRAVEPRLGWDRPAVLKDYPPEFAGYARIRPSPPPAHAERWEIYLGGIEIANACSEVTDPEEQRKRFEKARRTRERLGLPVYPPDEAFLAALERGLPETAGIAVGLDRLVMVLADARNIREVTPFA